MYVGSVYSGRRDDDCGSSGAEDEPEQCFYNCEKECGRAGHALSVHQTYQQYLGFERTQN